MFTELYREEKRRRRRETEVARRIKGGNEKDPCVLLYQMMAVEHMITKVLSSPGIII